MQMGQQVELRRQLQASAWQWYQGALKIVFHGVREGRFQALSYPVVVSLLDDFETNSTARLAYYCQQAYKMADINLLNRNI